MVDYKKEYYNLIEERGLTDLPSQEIINENRKLALYVWDNLLELDFDRSYYKKSLVYEYSNYNIKDIFAKYKDDIDFWSSILKNGENFNLLFIADFQKDFKFAYESLISDKELIREVYSNAAPHTDTDKLFKFLDESDKKLAFLQKSEKGNFSFNFFVDNLEFFDDEAILAYMEHYKSVYDYLPAEKKDDERFINVFLKDFKNFAYLSEKNKLKFFNEEKIINYLYNNSHTTDLFNSLPDEKKNDIKYINAYLNDKDWSKFFELSHENQNKMLDMVKKWDVHYIKRNYNLNKIDKKVLNELVDNNDKLLSLILKFDFQKWYPKFEEKAKQKIQFFETPIINQILIENEHMDFVDSLLKSFDNFDMSKENLKLLTIIDKKYSDKVEQNRNLYIDIALNKKITPEMFNNYSKEVLEQYKKNDINEDMFEALLFNLKKKLPQDVLAEIRVSNKDLFDKVLNGVDIFENLNNKKTNKP